MYASSHGHEEVISLFISVFRNDIRTLQLHKRNNDGLTALHLAVRNHHEGCARLLTREAQCFPTTFDKFPDPRELDREPTPTGRKLKVVASAKIKMCSKENKRSTGTMTIEEESKTASRESSLSVLECSVGDIPISNYTHPFGLQTTKCTQVVSVDYEREGEETAEVNETEVEAKTSQKVDEWPAIPLQLKPVSHKLLGPLIPIEAPATHPNTFHRKCLLKENNCNLTGLRVKARHSTDSKNPVNGFSSDDNVISGSSIKTLQPQRTRQPSAFKKDSAVNILPLIPCNKELDALPPVKYSMRRSSSSKKDVGFSSASYISVRADQTPREMETFKNNLIAFS